MKIILTLICLLSFMLGLIGVIVWKIRKKTVKIPLVLIGISVVIYVAAAFIPEQRPENSKSVTTRSDNMEKPDNIEEPDNTKEPDDAEELDNAEKTDNTEYIGSDMPLITLSDFSQERAFVQYEDYSEEDLKMAEDGVNAALTDDEDEAASYAMKYLDYEPEGGNRVALIDTKGRIIWKSERTRDESALMMVSEFKDGLAFFIFSGNEGEKYNIIDLEGNVSYIQEFSEDFMILSHGGGVFLTAKHIVDFDKDEWQIGAIDKDGNIVTEYQTYSVSETPKEPLSVEQPADPSDELQEIDDALAQLAEERQAWVEACWEYEGEIDEEYYRMISETEMDFQNRRDKLTE